jgi:hypothetical protein
MVNQKPKQLSTRAAKEIVCIMSNDSLGDKTIPSNKKVANEFANESSKNLGYHG